jgi:hypothetical protein
MVTVKPVEVAVISIMLATTDPVLPFIGHWSNVLGVVEVRVRDS